MLAATPSESITVQKGHPVATVAALAARMGLVRFPDLLARMHTATKPQVLGVLLMMLGLGLRLRSGHVIWMLVPVALLQMATSPVAAHMVARAGYRTGKVDSGSLVVDELTGAGLS